MISLLVGLFTVAAGLWGMLCWFPEFVMVLKGAVPLMVVMGGAVAVIAGLSALRRPPKSGSDQ
jgi:hypothetical protein